jgi:DNA adenine methylase
MYIRPPFKQHGGKRYLYRWILSHLPPEYEKLTYLEPYAGAASVLLNKHPSQEECLNDLDDGVMVILRAIRDQCDEFVTCLKKTKYCQENFDLATSRTEFADHLDYAVNEFVLRRMSRGGLKTAFAWSERKRGGKPGDENAWDTMYRMLPFISERLQSVYLLNEPAIDVIKAFNLPSVLLYADPPYLQETRESKNAYRFEMTTGDHVELSNILHAFQGKAIISGYPSSLYSRLYKDWRCEKKKIANHASQQKTKPMKLEMVWANY